VAVMASSSFGVGEVLNVNSDGAGRQVGMPHLSPVLAGTGLRLRGCRQSKG
jgi:hypothetical protein